MPVDHPSTLPEPLWPTQRGLDRYNALLGADISALLSGGGMWVDIGPGLEALPMLPFLGRSDVELRGIGIHARAFPATIEFTLGEVPGDVAFFDAHAGKATLVTDVYSSVSYSDDPLLALAYCGLLLKAGGTCGAFTELKRIGDLATWDRAIRFFRSELHLTMTFEAVAIVEDASKAIATALRIRATRERVATPSFSEVAALLHAQVGHPVASGTIWEAPDRSARIVEVAYR